MTRFSLYEQFPCRVVLLSKRYNEHGCFAEASKFVLAPEAELDTGYATILQRQAWRCGGAELPAVHWLLSPAVQAELDMVAKSADGTSMDVQGLEGRNFEASSGTRDKVGLI